MSRPTCRKLSTTKKFSSTGLSPYIARLSRLFELTYQLCWPVPRSLATTNGVSIDFFSSGYLDVSVPRVRFADLWIQPAMPERLRRVSPFGNPRIKECLLLPEAYRSLPRPSSLPGAKASALCPFHLTSFLSSPWNPQPSALDPLLFSKGSTLIKTWAGFGLVFKRTDFFNESTVRK